MMNCAYGVTLDELLKLDTGLLVLVGAEDDNDSDGSDGDDGDDDGDGDGDGSDDSNDGDGDDDDSEDSEEIKRLKAENARLVKRRKEAEKRLTTALNEVADLKKNGSTDDTVKKELADANTTITNLQDRVNTQAMDLALLKSTKHDWVNNSTVLKLVDRSDIEIDEDGSVHGLEDALDQLAEDQPFLLKAKDDDDKGDKGQRQQRRTGDRPGSKADKDTKAKAAREADLKKRFPALRR